jgi:hypothetical protein
MYLALDIREFTACRSFRLRLGYSVVPHTGYPILVSVLELLLSVVKRWKTKMICIKLSFVL